ncbi:MAG: monovalent cation/H(+) antiporter subunit G [Lachnospiraceae bacterium]|nr:monovalent cation/H(+) antiporter subunit G [Lachnospiraceae bacterium]
MLEWVRFFCGAFFIIVGIVTAFIATFGMFRFTYVLNRMHSAAMCDTLALGSVLIGLIIFYGVSFASLKLAAIICFLWLASPVSSHLLARLEVTINEKHIKERCEVQEDAMD